MVAELLKGTVHLARPADVIQLSLVFMPIQIVFQTHLLLKFLRFLHLFTSLQPIPHSKNPPSNLLPTPPHP
jgi:hypothetical protein